MFLGWMHVSLGTVWVACAGMSSFVVDSQSDASDAKKTLRDFKRLLRRLYRDLTGTFN